MDYEEPTQYKTTLSCPECGEHTFQTTVPSPSGLDFIDAECTNCGHALTEQEIRSQTL